MDILEILKKDRWTNSERRKLVQLKELDLYVNEYENELREIPAKIGRLVNLQLLYLDYNQLKEIPAEIGQLTNLQELYLNSNQLKRIPSEIGQLTNLQILSLGDNNLVQLPPEIGQLTNLRKLYLYDNKLIRIPPEIGQLANLIKLYLNNNKLVQIPPEIGQLIHLQELHLHYNHITNLPSQLGNLRNLRTLMYFGNPIEYIPPNIIHLLDKKSQNIYGDRQNVHNHYIQESIRRSIINILNDPPNNINILDQIINDPILNQKAKNGLVEYNNDQSIHSILNITFGELVKYVWARIINHKDHIQIKEILNEEMNDSICKCFTGRISRLVNCLNGFYDDVNVNISDSQQIGNIIINVKNRMVRYDKEEHKRLVVERLEELAYNRETINLWVDEI